MLPPYGIPFFPANSEAALKSLCLRRRSVKDHLLLENVVSADGSSCSGSVYCVYLAPEQFLENQEVAVELLVAASNQLKDWGAGVIGLGGLTGVVGSRGKELSRQVSVPVTSGNSLTVYSTVSLFEKVVADLGMDVRGQKVTVIGFPGSISLAIAQILAQKGVDLILVSKRETSFLKQFLSLIKETTNVDVEVTDSLEQGLKMSKIILSATSTGGIIDPELLDEGTVVIDIAQPRDVIARRKKRNGVLILDGGLVTLPSNYQKRYKLFGWRDNDIPGCLGETILLALEDRCESFSVGRRLSIEKIEEIGMLGKKHGLILNNFISFKKSVSASQMQVFADVFKRNGDR